MNSELAKKALEKVGNPNVLVNLVSRRVRQLTSGSRPLLLPADIVKLGAADIAMMELIEDKMGWELLEPNPVAEAPVKKRKKH